MRIIEGKSSPRVGCDFTSRCFKKVLWRVGRRYLCNKHFDLYCETNEFDLDKTIRLSDYEQDFEIIEIPSPDRQPSSGSGIHLVPPRHPVNVRMEA